MGVSPAPLGLSALVLPDRHPPAAFLDDVREAERFGVRSVSTYDHLTWPALAEGPWYGCVPLLAAAATVTTTVRLGMQVATPNYRHPVPFAKELMTLDRLSGGRLDVGLGAGSEGPDSRVLGEPAWPLRERLDRFTEWLDLLDRLLREPVVSAQGRWYSAVDAHQLPGCVQRPRAAFTIAATGPRALALVARHGQSWVSYGPYGGGAEPEEWFTVLGQQSARLDEALAAAGRPAGEVRRIAQFNLSTRWPFASAQAYTDTLARLGELGFDEVSVHWPRPDGQGLPRAALPMLAQAHGLGG